MSAESASAARDVGSASFVLEGYVGMRQNPRAEDRAQIPQLERNCSEVPMYRRMQTDCDDA